MASPTAATASPAARGIGLGHGVALYVCAILGAGVLVFPGQAASLAGPASLLAWGFSALIGVPLAFTFAGLAARFPDAGGVAVYASRAFGWRVGAVTGWWYLLAGSIGQTIVPLTAGYYVVAGFGLDPRWAPAVAAGVLVPAVLANLAGLRLGAGFQIGLALAVAAILLVVIAVALPQLRAEAFVPFAPHGLGGVGRAVVVLFFAFAGWEAIAHLSGEFRDVERTLPRATVLTVLIVTALYLGVALAVVGTDSYGSAAEDRIAIGTVLGRGLGVSAVVVVAVAAVVICLGTTNAFVASVSRLAFALGRDGVAPRIIARSSRSGVPVAGVLLVGAVAALGLIAAALLGWGTAELVVIPSVLVLATYLIGTGAAARLLRGRARVLAFVAVALLLVTVPFAGWTLVLPPAVAAVVLVVLRVARARR